MALGIRLRIPHFGELGIAGFRRRIPCGILSLGPKSSKPLPSTRSCESSRLGPPHSQHNPWHAPPSRGCWCCCSSQSWSCSGPLSHDTLAFNACAVMAPLGRPLANASTSAQQPHDAGPTH